MARKKKTIREHRQAAKVYTQADAYHWHRRILKEQKDSPRVQALVVSGRADRWIENNRAKA